MIRLERLRRNLRSVLATDQRRLFLLILGFNSRVGTAHHEQRVVNNAHPTK